MEGVCWPKQIQIHYNIFTASKKPSVANLYPHLRCLVYSGAMDIVLAFVPWKMIWALTMNRKEKIGVLVAMSMGVL